MTFVAACLVACGGAEQATRSPVRDPWSGRGQECVRPFLGRESPYSEVLDGPGADDPFLASVPPEAGRTMRAAGLEVMVARAVADAREPDARSLDRLVAAQELGMRLISLEAQLAAIVFEAECTGELIEAMNFELEDRSDLRDLRLALGSLVVGAVSAAAAGIWDLRGTDSKGPAVLGLTGGIASAGLGGAAFIERAQWMRYEHERNLLAPVLAGEDPHELFPGFVFRLLVLPAPGGGPTPRDRLLVRWRQLLEESVPKAERQAAETLLFGQGGVYSQKLLALRERLYDMLESELNAQARDLELLDRFLVRALQRTKATE